MYTQAHMWKAGDSLQKLILSFHQVDSRDCSQGSGLVMSAFTH